MIGSFKLLSVFQLFLLASKFCIIYGHGYKNSDIPDNGGHRETAVPSCLNYFKCQAWIGLRTSSIEKTNRSAKIVL